MLPSVGTMGKLIDLDVRLAHTETIMKRDELNELLEQQFAKFAGQIFRHVDQRIEEMRTEIANVNGEVHGLYDVLDGIAQRLDTDTQERAAMANQLDRHAGWIGQLAESTNTKLVPEQ